MNTGPADISPTVVTEAFDKVTLVRMLQEQNLAIVQAFMQELQVLCAKYNVEVTAVANLSVRVKE